MFILRARGRRRALVTASITLAAAGSLGLLASAADAAIASVSPGVAQLR